MAACRSATRQSRAISSYMKTQSRATRSDSTNHKCTPTLKYVFNDRLTMLYTPHLRDSSSDDLSRQKLAEDPHGTYLSCRQRVNMRLMIRDVSSNRAFLLFSVIMSS